MTTEIAERLKPIFKKDFKVARYQIACTHDLWSDITPKKQRRIDRKSILFYVTKELYLECLEALGQRTH